MGLTQSTKCPMIHIIRYKINKEITEPELRITDEKGVNLGIMKREDAFRLAWDNDKDVVEISGTAKPPVVKIIDFDKFRYQKDKEEKKKRASEKTKELKRVRITPRAAENDLQVKLKKVEKFLSDGHKVEVGLFLKGREKGNKDWGLQKLKIFLGKIETPHMVTMPPRQGGRGFISQISPKK